MTVQVTALNSKCVSAAYISNETDDRAQCEAVIRDEVQILGMHLIQTTSLH